MSSSGFKRTDRIAEMMQRKLAQLIQQELKQKAVGSKKDLSTPVPPRLITISAVKVTKDLGHAKVYFTVLNADPLETLALLTEAAGYLRGLLAKSLILRVVPQLHFIYDESIEYAKHLTRLINDVNAIESDDLTSEE